MAKTRVVNVRKKELNKRKIKDFNEWISRENSVYIGRDMSFYVEGATASKWENPFNLKDYSMESVLELYRLHIEMSPDNLKEQLHELEGKELGCWCYPNPCHGDILMNMLKKKK